jgi:hypothetical protein
MGLNCVLCTDEAITAGYGLGSEEVAAIPLAFTLAPLVQTFNVGGQQIAAPLALPVCFPCREKQLGKVSKNGLILS